MFAIRKRSHRNYFALSQIRRIKAARAREEGKVLYIYSTDYVRLKTTERPRWVIYRISCENTFEKIHFDFNFLLTMPYITHAPTPNNDQLIVVHHKTNDGLNSFIGRYSFSGRFLGEMPVLVPKPYSGPTAPAFIDDDIYYGVTGSDSVNPRRKILSMSGMEVSFAYFNSGPTFLSDRSMLCTWSPGFIGPFNTARLIMRDRWVVEEEKFLPGGHHAFAFSWKGEDFIAVDGAEKHLLEIFSYWPLRHVGTIDVLSLNILPDERNIR